MKYNTLNEQTAAKVTTTIQRLQVLTFDAIYMFEEIDAKEGGKLKKE